MGRGGVERLSRSESRSDLCLTPCSPGPWNSPGQNTGVGSRSFLQGIFPTQRSNPGVLHCRWTLYQLSHKGSPRILQWVAYPFSRGSSQRRNQSGVFCIAVGFFTSWASREAYQEGWTEKSTKFFVISYTENLKGLSY